jgi:hypothetical protein
VNAGTFKKGEKRPKQGRPKGVVNKTTLIAKEAIALAAEGLGGSDRLIEWAQEDPLNERAFWTQVFPKLVPVQVDGPGKNGAHVFEQIVRTIVDPKA